MHTDITIPSPTDMAQDAQDAGATTTQILAAVAWSATSHLLINYAPTPTLEEWITELQYVTSHVLGPARFVSSSCDPDEDFSFDDLDHESAAEAIGAAIHSAHTVGF
ncbi:hypothetical protein [Streptosporangium sp. NPDC001681]|uniref:hypothetical protein n=1 Tax=Streptosporangium sp. NPDC001681 TaxID=3154395 RepID=UPI003332021F